MLYFTKKFLPMQVEVVVLRVLPLLVAGLGFCTPWWPDQRG